MTYYLVQFLFLSGAFYLGFLFGKHLEKDDYYVD